MRLMCSFRTCFKKTTLRRVFSSTAFNFSNEIRCQYLYTHFQKSKKYVSIEQRYSVNVNQHRYVHGEHEDVSEYENAVEDALNTLSEDDACLDQPQLSKNMLYPNSSDPLINEINICASIKQMFDVIKINESNVRYEHVAQCVLSLVDFQNLYIQINMDSSNKSDEFITILQSNQEYQRLLTLISRKINEFDTASASFVLLSLQKLGMDINDDLLQLLVIRLQSQLQNEFCLASASRFISTIFNEPNSLRPFFIVQNLIPNIINSIAQCKTAQDVRNMTLCLQRVHLVITVPVLNAYKNKIRSLKQSEAINPSDYKTFLSILSFLNCSQWKDQNTKMITEYMLELRDHLHLFNPYEILQLFEVFLGNQEPACILIDIQRCSSKWLLQYEDEFGLSDETKLKLMLALIYFGSTPQHRQFYEKQIHNLLKKDLEENCLYLIRRILSFIKTSDLHLSTVLWSKLLKCTKANDDNKLIKMCYEYAKFNIDKSNFRHQDFENNMNELLKNELENGTLFYFPWKYSVIAMYLLPYCDNKNVMSALINKITDTWEQLSCVNCLHISKGVDLAMNVTKNKLFTKEDYIKINNALDKYTTKQLLGDNCVQNNNLLWKSFIYRKSNNNIILELILKKYGKHQDVSSLMLRNVIFCFTQSNIFLPEVLEQLIKYVVEQENNVTVFNVEQVLYLCFYFGYCPKNDHFFDVVIDTVLRDQERLSGLSYLKAALALSFFHRLPNSFIKNIFNVKFLDKLDLELANCYSKDKYPFRVRNTMMLLNRSVCLDYPEAQIPWFHQKYIQEQQISKFQEKDQLIEVDEYLRKIFDTNLIQHNVCTPYGYIIDIVLTVNSKYEIVEPSHTGGIKLAFLLMFPTSYVKVEDNLKGAEQLKVRHLEILGYKVITIKFSELKSLITGDEKVSYLTSLIWPEKKFPLSKKY